MDIIIPHSNTSNYRERNLNYVVKHYSSLGFNIIVSEQNGNTTSHNAVAESYENSDGCVDFIENHGIDPDDYFCKSILINNGVSYSSTDYVMICDNDCILSEDTIRYVTRYMMDYDYFVPFNSINFLNEGHTRQFIRKGSFKQANPNERLHVNRYTGGAIIVKRSLFNRIGGFDEEIKGWGKEDDAFLSKCKRVGANIGRVDIDSPLLHLYHPTASTDEYRSSERYLKNTEMLAVIKRMSDDDFHSYRYEKKTLEELINEYRDKGMLSLRATIHCGEGSLVVDSTAYDLIPNEKGEVGLEELLQAAYNDDGAKTLKMVFELIETTCKGVKPEEQKIIDKYHRMYLT